MIEGYLLERESLLMVFVLVDGEIGPTPLDVRMLDWMRQRTAAHGGGDQVDKVKSSRRDTRLTSWRPAAARAGRHRLPSAAKNTNLDKLRGLIDLHLAI